MFIISTYCGTVAQWQPVSAARLTRAAAERRLSLYRAVRGADWLYRIDPA